LKLLSLAKDGGEESTVWAYFLIEAKSLFSIVLLRFEDGSREAYHTHAFNSISWVLKGGLQEKNLDETFNYYPPSFWPIITKRDTFHQVRSYGRTWVLSFRGPWDKYWKEWLPKELRFVTLTHGRKEV
jgi:hypothetical protein